MHAMRVMPVFHVDGDLRRRAVQRLARSRNHLKLVGGDLGGAHVDEGTRGETLEDEPHDGLRGSNADADADADRGDEGEGADEGRTSFTGMPSRRNLAPMENAAGALCEQMATAIVITLERSPCTPRVIPASTAWREMARRITIELRNLMVWWVSPFTRGIELSSFADDGGFLWLACECEWPCASCECEWPCVSWSSRGWPCVWKMTRSTRKMSMYPRMTRT